MSIPAGRKLPETGIYGSVSPRRFSCEGVSTGRQEKAGNDSGLIIGQVV
jgi:hypothetical protein